MACSFYEFIGLAIVALIFCSISNRVQYYTKMIVFIVSALFAAVLPIPLMLPRPRDYRNALIPAWCIVKVGQLIGASYEIRGLENINRDSGGVVLINHQSAIDLIVLGKLWPVIGRATQVAKKEIFYLFPFGLACYLWGTLFINRQNQTSARNVINRESKAINERKSKILFFPEGTRNPSETLLPFKKGSFHVAIQAQCPIQPIVVSRYTYLDSKRKYFGRGRTIISILPEVNTKGMIKSDIDSLVSNVQNLMQESYEKISDEASAAENMKYY
ncbi:CLUMA_CG004627, isoform A [Clunio marinus]|uniref:1-acyl-sn-glycerol-3-phosphate acyltransferase n=1 Tax=Clunio marinus TaxID=568069 RepID=A0A1J1HTQ3_9DIPT|nr:CLUMA_CG004627, isoform A [Clunio marinus]